MEERTQGTDLLDRDMGERDIRNGDAVCVSDSLRGIEIKADIVKKLEELLMITRAGCNLKSMTYVAPGERYEEEVVIEWQNGYKQIANVYCDSGVAIIKDVLGTIL